MNYLELFIFGIYPYICLTIFFLGSLIRFDRDQYTWKSDSSQLLRKKQLRLGSMLFHIGVLFLFFGHFFGEMPKPLFRLKGDTTGSALEGLLLILGFLIATA